MSLKNCHVNGLHSIMLLHAPNKTIRLFVAKSDHELWKNIKEPVSLAYHPHHCDLTLLCTHGNFFNRCVRIDNTNGNLSYTRWAYKSHITDGELSMKKDGHDKFSIQRELNLTPGSADFMHAEEIHTVYVPKGKSASWIVMQGVENENYESVLWSNEDLDSFDGSHLYKPFDNFDEILFLLRIANLY